eukprot:6212451-Pleurochrysis_carterae.AAC.3
MRARSLSGQWSRCVRATATSEPGPGSYSSTGGGEVGGEAGPEQLSREGPAQGWVELILAGYGGNTGFARAGEAQHSLLDSSIEATAPGRPSGALLGWGRRLPRLRRWRRLRGTDRGRTRGKSSKCRVHSRPGGSGGSGGFRWEGADSRAPAAEAEASAEFARSRRLGGWLRTDGKGWGAREGSASSRRFLRAIVQPELEIASTLVVSDV